MLDLLVTKNQPTTSLQSKEREETSESSKFHFNYSSICLFNIKTYNIQYSITTTQCGIDAFTVNVTLAYETKMFQGKQKEKSIFGQQSHIFLETTKLSMLFI